MIAAIAVIADIGNRNRGFLRMNADFWLFMSECSAAMKIIPTGDVIADLERKATDCETKAESEAEPMATQLKDEAKRIRAWIADLKTGRWSSAIK